MQTLIYENPAERPRRSSWFGGIGIALFFIAVVLIVVSVVAAIGAFYSQPRDWAGNAFWNKMSVYGGAAVLLAGFGCSVAGVIRSTNRLHSLVGLVLNTLGLLFILTNVFHR